MEVRIKLDLSQVLEEEAEFSNRWILVTKGDEVTVSNITDRLRKEHSTLKETQEDLLLFLDGVVLVPWEKTSILRDGDLVEVKKRGRSSLKRARPSAEESTATFKKRKVEVDPESSSSSSSSSCSSSSSSEEDNQVKSSPKPISSGTSSGVSTRAIATSTPTNTQITTNNSHSKSNVQCESSSSESSTDDDEPNTAIPKLTAKPAASPDEAAHPEGKAKRKRRPRKRKPKNRNKIIQDQVSPGISGVFSKASNDIDSEKAKGQEPRLGSKSAHVTCEEALLGPSFKSNGIPRPGPCPKNPAKWGFPNGQKSNTSTSGFEKLLNLAKASPMIATVQNNRGITNTKYNANETFDSYDEHPDMLEMPKVGQVVAFKVFELLDDCTPGTSDFKVGQVCQIDDDNLIKFKILNAKDSSREGAGLSKFSIGDSADNLHWQYNWKDLITPKCLETNFK